MRGLDHVVVGRKSDERSPSHRSLAETGYLKNTLHHTSFTLIHAGLSIKFLPPTSLLAFSLSTIVIPLIDCQPQRSFFQTMLTRYSVSWLLAATACFFFTQHTALTAAFVLRSPATSASPTTLAVASADHENEARRRLEFSVEPLPENDRRRARLARDSAKRRSFCEFGDELWSLRAAMDQLSLRLVDAIQAGQAELETHTREQLRDIEQRDPELVYMLELADARDAEREGRLKDAQEHGKRAADARSCLPHFNLEGLWVGKYGTHGYELINITYIGDTLIATKVTGDQNVPRGELTFQANLSPLRSSQTLQPIVLTEKAAKKWGTTKLPRYQGLGQVAEEGFRNHQWMDGQLIVIGDQYFSFAWIPIENQIFFGRPSPELALKMLRESGNEGLQSRNFSKPPGLEASIDLQKQFAKRCLEVTDEFEDGADALGCIWHDTETEECYFE